MLIIQAACAFEERLTRLVFLHEVTHEGTGLDVAQNRFHAGLCLIVRQDAWAGDVLTILRRVGDRVIHVRNAALVDQVYDQLHFVQTLEIRHFGCIASLNQRLEAHADELNNATTQNRLLTEQIEFADVVILNKVTDAGASRTENARKIIRALNGDARIIETDHSDVAADAILDTGLFNFDTAHEHPMWAKELYGFANHTPEDEEYGIESFVFHARAPFDPQKLHAVLNGALPGVIRAKGHFWIATRPDWAAEFNLAGALSSVAPLGRWWASVPQDRLPDHPQAQAEIARNWVEPWGDRRQELVFIGHNLQPEATRNALDACLLTEEEMVAGKELWQQLDDPFPQWEMAG